jgi:hypothetical protein
MAAVTVLVEAIVKKRKKKAAVAPRAATPVPPKATTSAQVPVKADNKGCGRQVFDEMPTR